ncbi:MAG: sugar phosphate isomerase/epimerase [Verrucomicrobiales bacterium]|nr:sugar phosphate isomerase/epimerase [Verrucomicrobiales bacterium]
MTPLQFSISTGCFYQIPIHEVLHWFAKYEFTDLEICSFPAHLDFHHHEQVLDAGRRIRESGLNALSFHAPFDESIDIASWDEPVRTRSIDELRLACDAAKNLGSQFIVLHPGPEKERNLSPHEWYPKMQLAAESLNAVANHCTDLKLTLLLENMLPHLMFGHIADMMYLLGAVASKNVGTCLDTGHAYLSGDLPRVANKLSGHLRMIHANDNCGKWDDHLPPGDGDIEWRPLLSQLIRQKFDGSFVLELNGNGEPDEILSGAVRAKSFLTNLASELLES